MEVTRNPRPPSVAGANGELQSILNQRRRLVEGSPPSRGIGGLSGASTAPTARQLPSRYSAPGAAGTADSSRVGAPFSAAQSPAPRTALRPVPLQVSSDQIPFRSIRAESDGQATQHYSRLTGDSPSALQNRVSALTLRNEALSSEVEKMKARLAKEAGFSFLEERNLLISETDTLLAETDRMSEKSRQLEQQREELSAEAHKIRAHAELSEEVIELRSENATFHRRHSELTEELCAQASGHTGVQRGLDCSERLSALSSENEELKRQSDDLSLQVVNLRRDQQQSEARHASSMSVMDREREGLREANGQLTREVEQLRATVGELTQKCVQLSESRASAQKDLDEARSAQANGQLTCEVDQLRATVGELQRKNQQLSEDRANAQKEQEEALSAQAHLRSSVEELQRECRQLTEDKTKADKYVEEARGLQASLSASVEYLSVSTEETQNGGSEGRLRKVMTHTKASSDDLRQAIGAVEALVEEARRELERKQFRERRAAFELLGNATDKADESLLEAALEAARKAGLEGEEIQKAEAKLHELRSMTEEQKAAKALREIEGKRKKDAFLLVKQDKKEELEALLQGLDSKLKWQDWRDWGGRTLYKAATELRAERVRPLLASMLGMETAPSERKPSKSRQQASVLFKQGSFGRQNSGELSPDSTEFVRKFSDELSQFPESSQDLQEAWWRSDAAVGKEHTNRTDSAPPSEPPVTRAEPDEVRDAVRIEPIVPPSATEQEALKSQAFRAVVRDDDATLLTVLEKVPREMWYNWQNKAGKDLLTLAQERGATTSYSLVAKALGILNELKRDSFAEGEAVWIFTPGDVQPVRATVLEDTTSEPDEILIEYWDGDDPAKYIDRALVRKSN